MLKYTEDGVKKSRKGSDIARFNWMTEFPRNALSSRAPVRLWGITWTSGHQAVLSHSDVVRLCRKRFATNVLQQMSRANEMNLNYLATFKASGLHPDTRAPLSEKTGG